MAVPTRSIEIYADTAAIVDRRAAERGVTVPEFITALVQQDIEFASSESAADIAELDRRWAEIEQGAPTVGNAEVQRWLSTWGTASYKPWSNPR